jgi:uncharacterized membrane protein YfcA
MEFLLVAFAAFVVAGLTLYSGFGLGTLMLPIFSLLFPVEAAVAATAMVHGANNLFKLAMVGRHANWKVYVRFGLPAALAAVLGALALAWTAGFSELAHYQLGDHLAVITPVKLLLGVLIFGFAMFELLPSFKALQFDRKYLPLGGLLSGFFGGLSGHQGALRSAFLAKTGIGTQAFVGTNAAIGATVDLSRLITYAMVFFVIGKSSPLGAEQGPLIATGIVAAFGGVLIGKRFLHKVTMSAIQSVTGYALLGIALALAAGLI